MNRSQLVAGLISLLGSTVVMAQSSTKLDNPIYEDVNGSQYVITADLDSADQYCIMNGFSQAEDFEVTFKDSDSFTFNGEEWTADSTDAVLESVECSGEVLSFGPSKRGRNRGKSRRKNRRRHGGGHHGGGHHGGGHHGGGHHGGGHHGGGHHGGGHHTVAEAMAKVATVK